MSKIIRLFLLVAIGAIAIAAMQFASPGVNKTTTASVSASISLEELMRVAGPLPETKIDDYF
jgi:hypothetical protein